MNEPNRTFRERLLDMETLNSAQGRMPQEQMRAMLDTRLSLVQRIGFGVLALAGLGTAVGFGSPAFRGHGNWEAVIVYRFFMVLGFLVAVAWTMSTGWTAVSGVLRRTLRPWVAATTLAMGFFYLAMLMFVFVIPISHEESRSEFGTQLALLWFFLLNTIGLCTILGVLCRGQFKSREKLLEIEYRLADLMEKLGDAKRTDRPDA